MRCSPCITLVLLLGAACTISVTGPVSNLPSYEVIEAPVAFYFETDSRDRDRVANVAAELEPHFPNMSWRIGSYEASSRDGLVVIVREQNGGVSSDDCRDCSRVMTVFVVYDQGRQIALERFENCSIFNRHDTCAPARRLVSAIDETTRRSRG